VGVRNEREGAELAELADEIPSSDRSN
jgi:hypothetical protein